jgi:hypothetical protein
VLEGGRLFFSECEIDVLIFEVFVVVVVGEDEVSDLSAAGGEFDDVEQQKQTYLDLLHAVGSDQLDDVVDDEQFDGFVGDVVGLDGWVCEQQSNGFVLLQPNQLSKEDLVEGLVGNEIVKEVPFEGIEEVHPTFIGSQHELLRIDCDNSAFYLWI